MKWSVLTRLRLSAAWFSRVVSKDAAVAEGRGVVVGKAVAVGMGVAVGVAVGKGVEVGRGVAVGVGVAVGTGVLVGYGVEVGNGVAVAVGGRTRGVSWTWLKTKAAGLGVVLFVLMVLTSTWQADKSKVRIAVIKTRPRKISGLPCRRLVINPNCLLNYPLFYLNLERKTRLLVRD